MNPPNHAKAAIIAAAIAVVPMLLYGHPEGPDAGYAGVPGESTCAACHAGTGGTGNVTVTFPNGAKYTPGALQHLVVTIADSSQKRWGFQLSARRATSSSTQAGTFTPGADSFTQLVCTQTNFASEKFGTTCPSSSPLQYIEQTLAGTRLGTSGPVTFAFDWTPPASDVGDVVLYVAANAANGDGSDRGDHIYTNAYTLGRAQSVQPSITSVVNAAGFQAGIEAGSWVTIQGSNLAGSTRTWISADIVDGKLPTSLDGVSVTIDGLPAYVYYISPAQINVQAPSDSALGAVNVQVVNNGASSNSTPAQLQTVAPAFFLWSGKYAVATRPDYGLVAPANLFAGATTSPARPGDTIVLWGTGFGPVTPSISAGLAVPSNQVFSAVDVPTVTIGDAQATVYGVALTPGSAGLYQIAVQVPPSLSSGDQTVTTNVAGVQSPAGVYISVQP